MEANVINEGNTKAQKSFFYLMDHNKNTKVLRKNLYTQRNKNQLSKLTQSPFIAPKEGA
jgi:hypothetical protein